MSPTLPRANFAFDQPWTFAADQNTFIVGAMWQTACLILFFLSAAFIIPPALLGIGFNGGMPSGSGVLAVSIYTRRAALRLVADQKYRSYSRLHRAEPLNVGVRTRCRHPLSSANMIA